MVFYSHGYSYDSSSINFDEQMGLVKGLQSNRPYYTQQKDSLYPIGYAADYTLYLLNTKNAEYIERAIGILSRILEAQIKDMQSDYYGIWLYDFFDTPEDYISPDYANQSRIISVLIEVYLEFRNFLPPEMVQELKNSCLISGFTIIHHCHEIDLPSSLIEILSMICIGEQFNKLDCLNFGITKMQTLLYYTLYNDVYMEYNYPEKIILFLEAIKYFRKYINNQYCLSSIQSIEKILWLCFYSHFNPKTLQWTGPISSATDDFLPAHYIRRIESLLGTTSLKNWKIPPEYYDYSPGLSENFTQILVTRGFSYPHWKFPTVASFYNTSEFSLGSFNRDDLWVMRRPCIGYFGSDISPYCLRIRCLRDGHDFSSATIHTVQHKEHILGHITFSTNRGDFHIANDGQPAYRTKDLRIRFQILGNSAFLECSNKRNSIEIAYKQIAIHYQIHYAVFDDYQITYQLTNTPDALYFDTILYSGEEIELNFAQLENAITAFSLMMTMDSTLQPAPVKIDFEGEYLISEQKTPDMSLKLKTPKKPNVIEFMTLFDRQYINDVRLEKQVDINKKLSGQYRFIAENLLSPTVTISNDHFVENKAYLTKIKNLHKIPLEDIDVSISELMNGLNNLSLDIARRYSIHIIVNLFESAKNSDVRFKNLIEMKYSQIFDEISYITKINKMKKIITELAARLQLDYRRFQINTKKSDKIAKVIQIINNEYADPNLSLQMISARIGISQAHLSREFHMTIGLSYVAYLLKVRMENAKKMLSAGKSVSEVMKACGYISDVTFNAAFKRYTGITAKKYLSSPQQG